MASGPGIDQGKGKFLRGFLPENTDAKLDTINAAWSAEGHEGAIGESLYHKIRSELGLTAKRGTNGRADSEDASLKTKAAPKGKKVNESSKAAKSPSPKRARSGDKGPSKTDFVAEMLGREPQANVEAVNGAWTSAGHLGQISPSIYFKVKRARVQNGERAASEESDDPTVPEPSPKGGQAPTTDLKPKPSPKSSKKPKVEGTTGATPAHEQGKPLAPRPTPTTKEAAGHGQELHQIEGEIDELMFRLKGLGSFAEVQEALRAARRLLVRSHQH